MTPTECTIDETERLLATYFKSQLPHSWPPCRALADAPRPAPRPVRHHEGRSRLMLAALCVTLLGLGLLLSSGTRTRSGPEDAPAGAPGLLKSATAEGKDLKGKGAPAPAPDRRLP